jgi:hypothetical protein
VITPRRRHRQTSPSVCEAHRDIKCHPWAGQPRACRRLGSASELRASAVAKLVHPEIADRPQRHCYFSGTSQFELTISCPQLRVISFPLSRAPIEYSSFGLETVARFGRRPVVEEPPPPGQVRPPRRPATRALAGDSSPLADRSAICPSMRPSRRRGHGASSQGPAPLQRLSLSGCTQRARTFV